VNGPTPAATTLKVALLPQNTNWLVGWLVMTGCADSCIDQSTNESSNKRILFMVILLMIVANLNQSSLFLLWLE
jgi:hypothetical protein